MRDDFRDPWIAPQELHFQDPNVQHLHCSLFTVSVFTVRVFTFNCFTVRVLRYRTLPREDLPLRELQDLPVLDLQCPWPSMNGEGFMMLFGRDSFGLLPPFMK